MWNVSLKEAREEKKKMTVHLGARESCVLFARAADEHFNFQIMNMNIMIVTLKFF